MIHEKVSINVQQEKSLKKEKRKTEDIKETRTNVQKPMTQKVTWANVVKEGLTRESKKVTNMNKGKNEMRGAH